LQVKTLRHFFQQIATLPFSDARGGKEFVEFRTVEPVEFGRDGRNALPDRRELYRECLQAGGTRRWRNGTRRYLALSFQPQAQHLIERYCIASTIGAVGFAHQLRAPGAVGFIAGAVRVDLLRQLAEAFFQVVARGKA